MVSKLIKIFLLNTLLFASENPSGAYDHGSSAGKSNWDISLTWNPFNYFEQGQSYVVLGYGLTKRLDIHGYYSLTYDGSDNFYGGFSYQFLNKKFLDLSTAAGIRIFSNNSNLNLFFPQLMYTVKLSEIYRVGGSIVNINDKAKSIGVSNDIFIMVKIYENIKYKIDITAGVFKPVLWEPNNGEWYPTYSLDLKIK
jgi:hypothetical protein